MASNDMYLIFGHVGIGTTAPSQALDVNGNINLSGYIVQEAWIAPTLQNNWVLVGSGYDSVGYYKNRNGEIHINSDGTVAAGGGCGTTWLTLEAVFRP